MKESKRIEKVKVKHYSKTLYLLLWYLKQSLPLTYRTKYRKGGKKYFCVWNMWFGKCFNIEEYEIK